MGFREPKEPEAGFVSVEAPDLPEDLRGTLFQNGPGKLESAGKPLAHPLDADGLAVAVSLNGDGKAVARWRFVRTIGYLRERVLNKREERGAYGTPGEGGPYLGIGPRPTLKNVANEGIMWWGGRLHASWPSAQPFFLDEKSLGTKIGDAQDGSSNLGGALADRNEWSATPRACAATGRLVNLGVKPGLLNTTVTIWEFKSGESDQKEGKLKDRWFSTSVLGTRVRLDGFARIGGWTVTPQYYVLVRLPLKVADVAGLALGGKLHVEVLQHDPEASAEIVLVPRDKQRRGEQVVVKIDNAACKGVANAFERDNGQVVVDLVAADRWDPGLGQGGRPRWTEAELKAQPKATLARYEIDPEAETWTRRDLSSRHVGHASVAAGVAGNAHRLIYCACAHDVDGGVGPLGGVMRVDAESGDVQDWVPGPSEFCGVPVFAPRVGGSGGEDDGYVLTLVFNGATEISELVVLDARELSKGPLARISLGDGLPYAAGACWADGLAIEEEQVSTACKLLKMYERKAFEWNTFESGFNLSLSSGASMKSGTPLR